MTKVQADRYIETAQALVFRAALFLLALFAVAYIPLGKGELAGPRVGIVATHAYQGDLPGRFASDSDGGQAVFASVGPAVAAELADGDSKADALAGKAAAEAETCADLACGGGFATVVLQAARTGYSPRAPPSA